ncbi:MAG: hypothetical protein WCC27_15680, partial [Acidobacteriaceae bacterium]
MIPASKAIDNEAARAIRVAFLSHLQPLRILSFTVPRFKLGFLIVVSCAALDLPRLAGLARAYRDAIAALPVCFSFLAWPDFVVPGGLWSTFTALISFAATKAAPRGRKHALAAAGRSLQHRLNT